MNGEQLKAVLENVFKRDELEELSKAYGVQERQRRLDIVGLVLALVLCGGTHEGGRQYDILRTYLENGAPQVTRGAFYSWFTEPLENLLNAILERVIRAGQEVPKLLPGILSGVRDWWIVDATTISLDKDLLGKWPGTGDFAALKIHKVWSVGTGNLVSQKITSAREHDSPHLSLDESWRGLGLLADLAYASIERLRECEMYGIRYVIRLKDNWKPNVDRITRGALDTSILPTKDFDALLEKDILLREGNAIDADVVVGSGQRAIQARLVGVPTPKGYCFFLTNLPRKTHGPLQVGEVYRVRWEVEIDNKVDKMGARIDEITARKPVSVRILVLASLINTTLARILVQKEKLEIVTMKKDEISPAARPPLHPIQVVRVMRFCHAALVALFFGDEPNMAEWDRIMGNIRNLGHDPNWRRRPSVLDKIQGLTAPSGPSRLRGPHKESYRN
jgi:hypothetical protein